MPVPIPRSSKLWISGICVMFSLSFCTRSISKKYLWFYDFWEIFFNFFLIFVIWMIFILILNIFFSIFLWKILKIFFSSIFYEKIKKKIIFFMIICKKITYSSFFSLPLIGHGLTRPLEVKHPIILHTNHIEPKCQTRE